ncbi:crcB protein [Gracilibacillus halophilus YIM-C55.5]|uniref:Fluoride-specific ion channel FluC n=1 Tax=Gracilibacillus halophilus YIM-C55.5 TaxID=1308866 RepID=N4WUL6_9BACI|nr:CrcB family protein [Gracilibacillus halophilus]ENH96811.1 crcB protein [Gracilibacillus halophilus YIM-C55.5]
MSIKKQTLYPFILVGIGGAIGSFLRFRIAEVTAVIPFPIATLMANIFGCFLLALIRFHPTIQQKFSKSMLFVLGTGMIGSLTTFSTMVMEWNQLLSQSVIKMLFYTLLHILGASLMIMLGVQIARRKENET